MKTTKSVSRFLMVAALGLSAASCDKKNVEPIPDKEFDSSVDASYALQVISDIDMICSHGGENDDNASRFFWHAPGSAPQNVYTFSRDTNITRRTVYMSFNDVMCRDGHRRSGTILSYFDSGIPNTYYYHDPSYFTKVKLINYQIDGWSVSLRNDFTIKNLAPYTYNPKTTNLTWSLNGDFDLKHPSDPTKNMHCNVDLVKTLRNTSDVKVMATKTSSINWQLSVTECRGSMFGEVSNNIPFKMKINDKKPLVRDFQCAPEYVNSVKGTEAPRSPYQGYHPFIDGVAEFTPAQKYPRVIYYGAENGSAPSCDNSGVIMIKGNSYPVDFKKVYE